MIAIITTKDLSCQHPEEDMEYQPEEEDTNVHEYQYCIKCNALDKTNYEEEII